MAATKKPSAAQLAARAKFTAMVKAKAAARKKTAKKVAVKKVVAKTHKDTKSHNVNIRVVSGFDKVVKRGNKTAVLYTKLSGLFDTAIISDIDQLKKEYFKLAKKYHPDAGGTKEQFQMLQAEYENLLKKLLSGSKLSSEQQNNEIILDEALRKAIDAIIGLPNISIELVGKWIWISGNTYPLRNELKSAGFMFAPKKKMWYYKGTESSGRGDLSMEEIKSKYGSTKIMPKDSSKFISGFGKITRAQRAKFKANLLKATKAINKRAV